jgi:hypothetical protein
LKLLDLVSVRTSDCGAIDQNDGVVEAHAPSVGRQGPGVAHDRRVLHDATIG